MSRRIAGIALVALVAGGLIAEAARRVAVGGAQPGDRTPPYVAPVLAMTMRVRGVFEGFDAAGRPVIAVPPRVAPARVLGPGRPLHGGPVSAALAAPGPVVRPIDEVVVRMRAGSAAAAVPRGMERRGRCDGPGGPVHVLRAPGGLAAPLLETLVATNAVEVLEPNYRFALTGPTDGDPLYAQQWALERIHARAAWRCVRESPVPIAIVDSGIMDHPDVLPSIAAGYDTVECDADPHSHVQHGTRVASIIGAVKDGAGMTGVLHRAHLMPVRAFAEADSGFACPSPDEPCADVCRVVAAIDWAVANGARVINASWAERGADSRVLRDAIARAEHVLFVVSAGLFGLDLDTDPRPNYPAAWGRTMDNVLTVMQSTRRDGPQGSFGRAAVHLAAPGQAILTTFGTAGHRTASAVSFAVPFVTAAAALAWSTPDYRHLTPKALRQLLIDHARPLPDFADRCQAGGVLDIGFLGETCSS